MSLQAVLATTVRILQQLRRDPRTIGLLLAVPSCLLILMHFICIKEPALFQRIGLPLVGVFPLISMFVVASVAMLRERQSGTLERLMTFPIHKVDLLLGYSLAFSIFALLQSVLISTIAIGFLNLHVSGPYLLVPVLAIINALLGMSLGLLCSAFAATEFQAVQLLPAFMLPQLLLSGLILPRASMAELLRWLSDVLPMTYAYDALHRIATESSISRSLITDILISLGITFAALLLGASTLHRRTD